MPKFISNINSMAEKFSGLFSILQIVTPAILIVCFYVFTLYMNANYVNKPEYDGDKDKTEKVLDEIKTKLNVIIIGQASSAIQLNGLSSSITDHGERLRYLERRESMVKR